MLQKYVIYSSSILQQWGSAVLTVIYLCNRFPPPLMLWVWLPLRVRITQVCDKVCQWLAAGRWFSPGPSVFYTNKTIRHNIAGILLKVALNTIKQTNKQTNKQWKERNASILQKYVIYSPNILQQWNHFVNRPWGSGIYGPDDPCSTTSSCGHPKWKKTRRLHPLPRRSDFARYI